MDLSIDTLVPHRLISGRQTDGRHPPIPANISRGLLTQQVVATWDALTHLSIISHARPRHGQWHLGYPPLSSGSLYTMLSSMMPARSTCSAILQGPSFCMLLFRLVCTESPRWVCACDSGSLVDTEHAAVVVLWVAVPVLLLSGVGVLSYVHSPHQEDEVDGAHMLHLSALRGSWLSCGCRARARNHRDLLASSRLVGAISNAPQNVLFG